MKNPQKRPLPASQPTGNHIPLPNALQSVIVETTTSHALPIRSLNDTAENRVDLKPDIQNNPSSDPSQDSPFKRQKTAVSGHTDSNIGGTYVDITSQSSEYSESIDGILTPQSTADDPVLRTSPPTPTIKTNVPFSQIKTAFALDISGSTCGVVLSEEKQVVQQIHGLLDASHRQYVPVLPWDHRLRPFTFVESLSFLFSDRGGTIPAVLTDHKISVDALSQCACWFLFTDGIIEGKEVTRFAEGICRNGLHGRSCVIVLFGNKGMRPIDCNVSVGLSVFGQVPDCLFLYHDVSFPQQGHDNVYILQSKGAFNTLLPENSEGIDLDGTTSWIDLPRIQYKNLLKVSIPLPQKLAPTEILLQNRQAVRLDDIYSGKADTNTAIEILDNEDNLKTFLLQGQLQGQPAQTNRWLTSQSSRKSSQPCMSPQAEALQHVQQIVELTHNAHISFDQTKLDSLQAKLRGVNAKRRIGLFEKMESQTDLRRQQVIQDAQSRLNSNLFEAKSNSWTPQMMSRVSQSSSRQAQSAPGCQMLPPKHTQPFQGQQQPGFPKINVANPHPGPMSQQIGGQPTYQIQTLMMQQQLLAQQASRKALHGSPMLISEYDHLQPQHAIQNASRGLCSLCGDTQAILCLSLQPNTTPPAPGLSNSSSSTLGIPTPWSRATITDPSSFPISAPELEAVSIDIRCDACVEFPDQVVKVRNTTSQLSRGVPLMREAFTGHIRQRTLENVYLWLEGRWTPEGCMKVLGRMLDAKHKQLEGLKGKEDVKSRERRDLLGKALAWIDLSS